MFAKGYPAVGKYAARSTDSSWPLLTDLSPRPHQPSDSRSTKYWRGYCLSFSRNQQQILVPPPVLSGTIDRTLEPHYMSSP